MSPFRWGHLADLFSTKTAEFYYFKFIKNAKKGRKESKNIAPESYVDSFNSIFIIIIQTKSRTHAGGPPSGANVPTGTDKAEERDVPRSIVAKANKVCDLFTYENMISLSHLCNIYVFR